MCIRDRSFLEHGGRAGDVLHLHAAADVGPLGGLLVKPGAAVDVVHDGGPGNNEALGLSLPRQLDGDSLAGTVGSVGVGYLEVQVDGGGYGDGARRVSGS